MDDERILIVSADGHWGGPPSMYVDYIDPQYREDLLALTASDEAWRAGALTQRRFSQDTIDLIDADGTLTSGGELGAWEMERRLVEMDRQGVAAELLLAGHQETVLPFFSHVSPVSSPEHRQAGVRAYHRQLADVLADSGGRLMGSGDPGPCTDMDTTVADLRWMSAHGFVAVGPPGEILDPSLPPLYDRYYEPFWEACAEGGLALNVHAGYGFPQGMADQMSAMNSIAAQGRTEEMLSMSTLSTADLSAIRIDQFPPDHPFRMALTNPRRIFWQLMMAGVFDRHPSLQLVFTEIRADWVAGLVEVVDEYFADGHAHLAMTPREYWRKHVWMAPSSTRSYEVAARHDIGIDRLMFGTDYPHPEGTWPNTDDWIRHAFAGVSVAEARLILGQNAIRCFGLDGVHLRSVADQVGPRPAEVLGNHQVDERVVAQFHTRAGYSRPAEQVDPEHYRAMIAEDESGLWALS